MHDLGVFGISKESRTSTSCWVSDTTILQKVSENTFSKKGFPPLVLVGFFAAFSLPRTRAFEQKQSDNRGQNPE